MLVRRPALVRAPWECFFGSFVEEANRHKRSEPAFNQGFLLI